MASRPSSHKGYLGPPPSPFRGSPQQEFTRPRRDSGEIPQASRFCQVGGNRLFPSFPVLLTGWAALTVRRGWTSFQNLEHRSSCNRLPSRDQRFIKTCVPAACFIIAVVVVSPPSLLPSTPLPRSFPTRRTLLAQPLDSRQFPSTFLASLPTEQNVGRCPREGDERAAGHSRPRPDGYSGCRAHRGPSYLEGLPDLRLRVLWWYLLRL